MVLTVGLWGSNVGGGLTWGREGGLTLGGGGGSNVGGGGV